ncbi:uncharacterized protein RVIR1_07880 [Candidatus Rickettsiella viridis]|uniref:Uncharacterized protein n=1 Tax=Candidatus Rickettsiella viridis TaxID=676208 RepID=A0A2Z5V7B4_9COXI|nr:hypothetical protein [Candidatus Rickettsiella viridis]BBB15277.1 uncharacterized protein RVIR1_07880 [Candidatus Rickettsiella viridis]
MVVIIKCHAFLAKIKEIQYKLDQAVTKKAVLNNQGTEALMRDLMEDPGYSMPKLEKDITEVYRHGFCGEACDAVLTYLQENISPAITSFEKVSPNPDHYYLREKGSDLIIEPSYKQFMYRILIDTNTGKLKEGSTEKDLAYVDNMPSLFIGMPQELESNVLDCLQYINKQPEYAAILAMWKAPAGIQKQKTEATKMDKQIQAAASAVLYGQSEATEEFANRRVKPIVNTLENEPAPAIYQALRPR